MIFELSIPNTSCCMFIDNIPQDETNIHPVTINNRLLLHTENVNTLVIIINNNLTDDDDIARKKICFYAQANV